MNIQEKCISLESKSMQIASRVKDLGGQLESELEQRRAVEQERKKEF